jgi:hypothetical protein
MHMHDKKLSPIDSRPIPRSGAFGAIIAEKRSFLSRYVVPTLTFFPLFLWHILVAETLCRLQFHKIGGADPLGSPYCSRPFCHYLHWQPSENTHN